MRLSRAQRRDLFRGEHPRIAYPKFSKGKKIPCPVIAGELFELSSLFSLVVTGIHEGAAEYELHYIVEDGRARWLRATMHDIDFDAWRRDNEARDRGEPEDPELAARASEESHYTSSSFASVKGEPPAIDPQDQRELTERSQRERLANWERQREKIADALDELKQDPVLDHHTRNLAFMESQLDKLDKQIRRESAKDAA